MRLFFDCVIGLLYLDVQASQVVLVVKNPPANAGDVKAVGSLPGLGRSTGGGHGNPLQYSCLEKPVDRSLPGLQSMQVAKSRLRLKRLHTHTQSL